MKWPNKIQLAMHIVLYFEKHFLKCVLVCTWYNSFEYKFRCLMTTETPVCVGSKQTLVFKLEVVLGCLQKTSVCYTIHTLSQKQSEFPHENQACRYQSICNGKCLVSVPDIPVCKQKPDINRCFRSCHDIHCFLCRDSDYFWDSVFHPIYYLVKIANELKLCYRLFCCILVQ